MALGHSWSFSPALRSTRRTPIRLSGSFTGNNSFIQSCDGDSHVQDLEIYLSGGFCICDIELDEEEEECPGACDQLNYQHLEPCEEKLSHGTLRRDPTSAVGWTYSPPRAFIPFVFDYINRGKTGVTDPGTTATLKVARVLPTPPDVAEWTSAPLVFGTCTSTEATGQLQVELPDIDTVGLYAASLTIEASVCSGCSARR